MDNPAEPMVGSSMNGPISQAGRKSAERDERERRDAHRAGRSRPGSAEQNNNDLTNHKQTQSCHQQSKIDEFFSSFLQSAQENILLYFNLY